MNFFSRSPSRSCLLLLLVLVTLLIYLPGLYGDFEFDDSINILENKAIKITALSRDSILGAATSGKAGLLGRSISMLSFAANYYTTEFEPFFFKLTNLLIHIVAGVGVYVFVRQLTLALDKRAKVQQDSSHASVVALTTAGIWLVHPLNVTSVLYIVQRMTSLAALFTFFALALYVLGRRTILAGHHARGSLQILLGLVPVTALAVMSKENGALAPYLMLCIELIVFRFECKQKNIRVFLYALFVALVIGPAIVAALNFDRLATFVASGYLQRDFSLQDRLLTQPQVMVFYLKLLLLPNAGQMGIFHDDFPISTSLMESPGTLISAGGIFALVVVGVLTIRRAPALAIGILWFFVGHSMESTVIALEMVHEHRNYLPIVGPIFAAVYYFWRADFRALASRMKLGIVIAVFVIFGAVTFGRSVEWSNLVDHAAIEVYNHPNSERATYQMGRMYFKLYENEKKIEMAQLANQYFARSAALGRVSILPMTAMIQMAYRAGFEPDGDLVELAVNRLKYGRSWEPNMVALANLVGCQVNQYCRLGDADMTALLLAALTNPDASPRTRGAAHTLLGGYYASKMGNIELGAPHIKAATEAEPERIDFRLELAKLYVVLDNPAAARAEVKVARKLDIWALHSAEIEAMSARLDSTSGAKSD